MSRRAFVESLCGGLGAVGLSGMLASDLWAASSPVGPHFAPAAKHVIFLFLTGGPSHLDLFDPKPALEKYAGQRPDSVDLRTERMTGGLLPSPFKFRRHGKSGIEVSELLPNLAGVVDELCVIRSMYTFNPTHTPAKNLIHSGNIAATQPTLGAWISYGLGSENENLPGFVVLSPSSRQSYLWRSGFLPAEHQGTHFNNAEADRRKLIRRASLDLTGLPPSCKEVEAFAANPSPTAYEELIERLLASPRYGERWGRHWLDVARWAEDHPTSESTNQPHEFAWRYRDWVIEAFNKDIPYDRFIRMQFAADLLPGFEPPDMRALGYIGNSPVYHKDPRLSRDVTETLASDDWDERVDGVSRGLLGLTVACTRCHDHKFDPITNEDYYGLAGVFASQWLVKRPIVEMDPEAAEKLVWDYERLYRLKGQYGLLKELSTIATELHPRIQAMKAEIRELDARLCEDDTPLTHAVVDCGVWIDGSTPTVTWIDLRPGQPRDLPVFIRGNVANPGKIVPRRFLVVFSDGEPDPFRQGSGRLELADRIVGEAGPLAARVWVNRVWGWHIGEHLVRTPSDFGTQGQRPTHPQLLNDPAARFVNNGWSIKWLHREIMLSATYRQASRSIESVQQADPTNRWLWRMNPRRLEIEAWRDAILQASGELDLTMGGPSKEVDVEGPARRSVTWPYSRLTGQVPT